MVKPTWETVWERVRAGKHVIVAGPEALPSAPSDLQVLYVNCEHISDRNRGQREVTWLAAPFGLH